MSELTPLPGVHIDPPRSVAPIETSSRRTWVAPSVAPHSTMTTLTQSTAGLLFLQASIQQCFDERGRPVACPT